MVRGDDRLRSRSENGFTLLEILVAMTLMAIILTLSVGALRHFWLQRSLTGSTDNVVTQLRSTQENAVSESYPVVYGVRFDVGEHDWHVVRYDPKDAGAGDDTCTVTETYQLESGVKISEASFADDAGITSFCRTATTSPAASAFVFFYPRGNATPGDLVLEHAGIGKSTTVEVSALTGRVSQS
jgi:prepilin-type N-terminal cleavage/methylation domain-containing protein